VNPQKELGPKESNQGKAVVASLLKILKRCEESGIRLGYPGEGGERPFRAWLVTDLLIEVLKWPSERIVVGERFDILLQDSEGFPVITIETKKPYRKASKKERDDFENRLSGYGTLRYAYFTNGGEWERLDIASPSGNLIIKERFNMNLQEATTEEVEAIFAPLAADRYFGGVPRFSRHSVTKSASHVLEGLAADLDQIICDWTNFLERLHSSYRDGKAGEEIRRITLSLFDLWCDKSLILSPGQASKVVCQELSKQGLSVRDLTKIVRDLNLEGVDIGQVVDSLGEIHKSQKQDLALINNALSPAYSSAVRKLCAQTAHVMLARALLYRVGEDQGMFPRVLSGEDLNRRLSASSQVLPEKPRPATDLLSRVRVSMEEFLPTVYKLGEFDWWLVATEKRAALRQSERLWLKDADTDFERVSRQLLRTLDAYFFGRVDVDVWRNVYQHYLPSEERQKLGGFYTPDELINFILDLADFRSESLGLCKLSFIDPACGSGAFVTNAVSRLLDHLNTNLPCHSHLKSAQLPEWKRAEQILNVVSNNLHGIDIHPFAALLTTLNVLFVIMPLYVKVRQKNPDYSLDLKVFSSDSLEKHDEDLLTPDLFSKLNSRVQLTEQSFRRYQEVLQQRFDRAFGNPPWGGVLKGRLAPVYDIPKKQRFAQEYPAAAQGKYDVYGLFMERVIQILKDDGGFGLVTQGTFIDKEWAAGLRRHLASSCHLKYLIDLNPFGQLFFRAMNIPCVTVASIEKDVKGIQKCVTVLSKPPRDFHGLNEIERRKKVISTVLEALRSVARSNRPAKVGFASAYVIRQKQLQEGAKTRWNLSSSESTFSIPKDWLRAADILEMRQGVTPGGCLDLFLLREHEARNLRLEKTLVHRAIKSKEIGRWRLSWEGRVIFYPYHLVSAEAAPAFTMDLKSIRDKGLIRAAQEADLRDALNFDKQLDEREKNITHGKGVNRTTVGELFRHRLALGIIRYPMAASYLVSHYERLEGRVFKKRNIREFNRRWYEFLWPRDPDLMLTKKRIVSPSLIKEVRFALDTTGYLSDHACLYLQPTSKTTKCFMVLRKQLSRCLGKRASREDVLKYCLAFLNGDYSQDRLVTGHLPTPKGFYAVTEDYLREIPIPPPKDNKLARTIVDLVTALTKGSNLEKASNIERELRTMTGRLLS